MDVVLSSDDDTVNPAYIEDIKFETVGKNAAVKTTINSKAPKKLRGRPRSSQAEIKKNVDILSESIKSKIKKRESCEKITTDITEILKKLDNAHLTSYITYIESFDKKIDDDIFTLLYNNEDHLRDIINHKSITTLDDKKLNLIYAKEQLEKHIKLVSQFKDIVKLLDYYINIGEESQNPMRLINNIIVNIKSKRALLPDNNYIFTAAWY